MPIPTFPNYGTLAHSGFAVQRASGVLRSTFESSGEQRKRFHRTPVERSVTYRFETKAAYLAFREWFKVTINRGASWFYWPDPVTGRMLLTRIKGGMQQQSPEQTLLVWDVPLTLECWDA